MASLGMAFGAAAAVTASSRRRAFTANATSAAKGARSTGEEKGPLDWILGALQKDDQLLETDPILKKVEEKNGKKSTSSVAVPAKKGGGFGGFFAKN